MSGPFLSAGVPPPHQQPLLGRSSLRGSSHSLCTTSLMTPREPPPPATTAGRPTLPAAAANNKQPAAAMPAASPVYDDIASCSQRCTCCIDALLPSAALATPPNGVLVDSYPATAAAPCQLRRKGALAWWDSNHGSSWGGAKRESRKQVGQLPPGRAHQQQMGFNAALDNVNTTRTAVLDCPTIEPGVEACVAG